jgi:polysaccharide biosynthesis protein PslH
LNPLDAAETRCVKKKLLFVSTRFLFPVDSGGKIRTTQILRGLKGGRFEVTLTGPASESQLRTHGESLRAVCDRFAHWSAPERPRLARFKRLLALPSSLPIPVATDRSPEGKQLVARELEASHDVVVFDFPHSAVLAPAEVRVPSVLFTHNTEAEIFQRHAAVSTGPMAAVWRSQFRKMRSFEEQTIKRFDAVVAVSKRDADVFVRDYAASNVSVIRTGVDLDYFTYAPPDRSRQVVFTGSMDWQANRDGIGFFMDEVWPLIGRAAPQATMKVVGRDPPPSLVRKARDAGLPWEFTGFVDDVREHVKGAGVYVIPLRVGGGTRLKVYEAMAMGCPIVSTAIGIEGLPVVAGQHYLEANEPEEFAAAVLKLIGDAELRWRLAMAARRFVEASCSYRAVAEQFERICEDTAARHAPTETPNDRRERLQS